MLEKIHATTILAVRHQGKVALGGDGQVTLGNIVMKHDAQKIRRLFQGKVLAGFAGAAADAFALIERFESKLKDYQAMLIAADQENVLLISGSGDVIQPSDGIAATGSGGPYATAAARALIANSNLDATAIVQKSLEIAGDMCIYTNRNILVETL